jgi:hypothetical protein
LIYMTIRRLDLSYVVRVVSQFMQHHESHIWMQWGAYWGT